MRARGAKAGVASYGSVHQAVCTDRDWAGVHWLGKPRSRRVAGRLMAAHFNTRVDAMEHNAKVHTPKHVMAMAPPSFMNLIQPVSRVSTRRNIAHGSSR